MPKPFNKKSWIINALRGLTRKFPPAYMADKRDKQYYTIKSLKGKDLIRVKYTCAVCGKNDLKQTEKERDHKIPVVGPEGFTDWNNFIDRHFCDIDNFQTLCIPCHKLKSREENGGREVKRRTRKKKK